VSRPLARYATAAVAILALGVYYSLGLFPFLCGLATVALGFFYSWKPVRLKAIPIADLASHCMMLAGLQFLAAYFTFGPHRGDPWLFPFVFVVAMSLYGELFNELRDFDGDMAAGLRHTASYLGPVWTHRLMFAFLVISVSGAIAGIVVDRLIPTWVLYLLGAAAMILLIRPVLKFRFGRSSAALHEPFQKPLEIAAAFALLVQFLVPWAAARINLLIAWTLNFVHMIGWPIVPG
jgi:4-hydroxybenzoate polyprenyltransferase